MRNLKPRAAAGALALSLALAAPLVTDRMPRLHAQAAAAQPAPAMDPSLLGGLRWRSIGPARGGRSQAVAGSASRPQEYYFGATGGGLWKTTDGGLTWRPVSDRFFKTSSVGAVAVAESNPDVVYVGMGETELRGNIIQGDGVYKSTDGGKTWTHVGLDKTMTISRIRIHPTNPDVAYVAALGNPYGPNPDRGVFKTTDGGKTWTKTLFRDDKTGAVDLSMDPKNPEVLYAGLWEVVPHAALALERRRRQRPVQVAPTAATTWTELTGTPGCPSRIWGKIGVSVSRRRSPIASTPSSRPTTAACSSRTMPARRGSWSTTTGEIRQRAFYYTRIYADPQVKDTVYVLNTGIYRSTDAGKTLRGLRVPHGDNHDLWIAPNDPKRMINSNDGGANVSMNGGETWTDQDYPTAQFYNVFTTAHVPYHVCGAQQDNSTACVSSTGQRLTTSTRWAAARAATSPPTRSTPTSSTPAATAGC